MPKLEQLSYDLGVDALQQALDTKLAEDQEAQRLRDVKTLEDIEANCFQRPKVIALAGEVALDDATLTTVNRQVFDALAQARNEELTQQPQEQFRQAS